MIASEREEFLRRLEPFSGLDADDLRALAEVCQVVRFPTTALIFREGEAGDCAYVVVRGSVQVFAIDRNGDEVVLAHLRELDHVGEQSLLPGGSGRRNASLRACEDVTLLRIPRDEFQQIAARRQSLKDVLRSEEHTSELQSFRHLVCRLLLEKQTSLNSIEAVSGKPPPQRSIYVAMPIPLSMSFCSLSASGIAQEHHSTTADERAINHSNPPE